MQYWEIFHPSFSVRHFPSFIIRPSFWFYINLFFLGKPRKQCSCNYRRELMKTRKSTKSHVSAGNTWSSVWHAQWSLPWWSLEFLLVSSSFWTAPTILSRYCGLYHFFMLLEKINVKSDENVRLCISMFNYNDVDTMLMKRRQKFLDGYERLDNLLCQITMSYSCN